MMKPVFFLDEHLSPAICDVVAALGEDIQIHSILTYQQGDLRGESDEEVLLFCRKNNFVLVTADLNTIPPLLKDWHDIGNTHAGVVFISNKSIRASDHVRIAKGLVQLALENSARHWTDCVVFLR